MGERKFVQMVLVTFNILETVRPIEAKFHVETPWDERSKVYSNGPGHMINMAAMPIYGT